MSYKTILVQVDLGRRCAARVQVAIRLARQHDAHLVALHALAPGAEPRHRWPTARAVPPDALAAGSDRSAALAAVAAAVLGGKLGIHIHPDGWFDGP